MVNELIVFENTDFGKIRVIEKDGEPWFVAKDVCDILEVKNVSDALNRIDEDEKGIVLNDTVRGEQKTLTISESGFYVLVLGSRKPIAKPFKRWVTKIVLPAIRKTGKYEVAPMTRTELIIQSAQALLVVEQEQSKIKTRLAIVEARQCTDSGYFSITAYANITKTQVDTKTANHLGKQAAQLSRDNGVSIDKTPHERWGHVNTYSEKVLKKVFASYRDLFV